MVQPLKFAVNPKDLKNGKESSNQDQILDKKDQDDDDHEEASSLSDVEKDESDKENVMQPQEMKKGSEGKGTWNIIDFGKGFKGNDQASSWKKNGEKSPVLGKRLRSSLEDDE